VALLVLVDLVALVVLLVLEIPEMLVLLVVEVAVVVEPQQQFNQQTQELREDKVVVEETLALEAQEMDQIPYPHRLRQDKQVEVVMLVLLEVPILEVPDNQVELAKQVELDNRVDWGKREQPDQRVLLEHLLLL
jgi:hypothetical protein